MKTTLWLLSLTTLAYAIPTPLPAEIRTRDDRPSWIERIFGAEKESDSDQKKDAETGETKKSGDQRDREDAADAKRESKMIPAVRAEKAQGKAGKGFSEEEAEVLENWRSGEASWKKKEKPLPPGLQKKVARGGSLPPGWQKKLQVGEVLEPELESEARSLPEEILKRLPESPEGTEIIRIGEEVVRVMEDTREIIDILNRRGGERSQTEN